ncbi:esterase-like activity of phytase family protein [Rhizobium sp. LCM 4573]|uniref:esterase-like activity of phytase family protein n=1 Tax=Rhizobium sp. LCM 4573 TaxID=1848291 RepID=UPI0008D957B6|nr:esterase-like activity of phytase family protein [Rhizobium sp. LCM 4573]OHV82065.1 hypothetical protein LCM4573_18875 [Rhizobium sp. LCM 4573]
MAASKAVPLRFALYAALLFCGAASPLAPAMEFSPVTATPVTAFKSGSDQREFGKLEFLGGIDFRSSDSRVGGISGIRFRADGHSFVAVSDNGDWITGSIVRNADGRLAGLSEVRATPMIDARGYRKISKSEMDAEGLALRQDEAIVSYEGRHRIDVYPDPGFQASRPSKSMDFVIPREELRGNGGLETVVVAPVEGPLAGAVVTIAERSIDTDGNLFAAVLEGPLKGIFKVARHDPFDVTDGAFLPNGDLLLLERSFTFTSGVGMRLRRIKGDSIRPGALVDGEVLLQADMGYTIDNMEGLDIIEGPDGSTRIVLVSDDNTSFLQRNLILEFRLTD